MKFKNHLVYNGENNGGYPFGVMARDAGSGEGHLFGPFDSFREAEAYATDLAEPFWSYNEVTIVRIETPMEFGGRVLA